LDLDAINRAPESRESPYSNSGHLEVGAIAKELLLELLQGEKGFRSEIQCLRGRNKKF
jgi:hypothetical protein